ncbi:MAG: aminoacyl-tRNA hydrolase [Candidatus Levybacteria bacterium RIFCSPLOWO2_01_FULL_38_13]|nr:MAG: aminoacyl-tRNA hydrolase [Candidatus Levybacteria bacterium RIFCSPHIGHO2_01_FULL_41_15]OGH34623.1 MAG: aminoacyl-tRNA hydrolase [Candidatus Levybacteria bacterium RIFCSPLOWO2_01_FULL_38_13]
MKLIVGLGNPGEKYERTRHNLGFLIVEKFLKDFENVGKTVWEDNKKFKSEISELEWSFGSAQDKHGKRVEKVILVKPKTYMNNSGLAVSLISQYFNISAFDIWVVHDDVDLPLGSMKIRFGGGSAGHKGVNSVMEKLGTDKFWRFRLGIGHTKKISNFKFKISNLRSIDDFVLSEFNRAESGKARKLIKMGSKAIAEALENGLDKTMNRFNTK